MQNNCLTCQKPIHRNAKKYCSDICYWQYKASHRPLVPREQIEKFYVNSIGANMMDLCKRFGCSYMTLRLSMREYGIQPKPKTRNWHKKSAFPQLQDKKWLEQELQTKSANQIAKELGTSVGNVSGYIYRHQIQSRALSKSIASKKAYQKKYPHGRFGEKAGHWKGGRRNLQKGYIAIYSPQHPHATKEGYVMEHRLVMERLLGRYLLPTEMIHHKNRNKSDNRLENLELASNHKEHSHKYFQAAMENDRLKQILKDHNIPY